MAKHAKPTFARTLSRNGARTGAALAVTAAGLLAAGPIASAGEAHDKDRGDHKDDNGYHKGGKGHHKGHKGHHHDPDIDIDHHESSGVINLSDNNVQVPIQVCNNYVPINVLGVQVPLEDFLVQVPIIAEESKAKDTGDACVQGAAGDDQEGDD